MVLTIRYSMLFLPLASLVVLQLCLVKKGEPQTGYDINLLVHCSRIAITFLSLFAQSMLSECTTVPDKICQSVIPSILQLWQLVEQASLLKVLFYTLVRNPCIVAATVSCNVQLTSK